ncbi:MAG TPA: serine--tRNA ligase, partial [Candidatus Dormibacteraeota bacterium]|nr:serine--tRNA ligase [Candidatus Dormibacteraeota bacterium]
MIPLQRLRAEPDAIREGARLKGEQAPVDEILELDARARDLRTRTEAHKADQNRLTKAIHGVPTAEQRDELADLKLRVAAGDAELRDLDARIEELLLAVPNPPHPSAPVGPDETGNVVVRVEGSPAEFAFTPLTHV